MSPEISEYSRAIECYTIAESLAREAENSSEVARAMYNHATVHYMTGEREKAISLASAALKIYQSIEAPDRETVEMQLAKWRESSHAELTGYGRAGIADVAENVDWVALDLNTIKRSKSIGDSDELRSLLDKLDNLKTEAIGLGVLGVSSLRAGDVEQAVTYFKRQLSVARETGDSRQEAEALNNLGLAYLELGNLPDCADLFSQALSKLRHLQDRKSEGQVLNNLGIVHKKLGALDLAIEFYQSQLDIAQEVGDRYGEGNALGNLGNIYAELKDFRRAIEYYDQHIEIARDIGDVRGEGLDLWNKSLALYDLGMNDEAIRCAEAALKILDHIGHPMAVSARASLGQWKKIDEIRLQLDERRRKALSDWHTSKFLYEYNEFMQGLDYAQSALEIFHQIGDPNEARIKKQINRWHSGRKSNSEEAEDFWCMSLAYSELGDFEQAIDLGKSALELFEAVGYPNTTELHEKIFEWRGKSQRKIPPKIEHKPQKKWWQFWR